MYKQNKTISYKTENAACLIYESTQNFGAFPPEGAGQFDAAWSSEGAIRLGSATARVSTTDSILMLGGFVQPDTV